MGFKLRSKKPINGLISAEVDNRVSLRSTVDNNTRVLFTVAPSIGENQSVNYQKYNVTHMPGETQVYTGTPSRTFSLSGIKLISRSSKEATANLIDLNILRGWTKPYFGNSNVGRLGAPPDVLYLNAYATQNNTQNLYQIPVVINGLTITYPNDVDYISTNDGTPFPTIMSIDITTVETHSPQEYSKFSLEQYKAGILGHF